MPKTKKINEQTLAVLSRVTVEGSNILLTCGQLDRKQYQAVNDVLASLGGKWNRKAQAHVFPEDPTLKLESVINSGEIIMPKTNGYFPTPKPIAEMIVGYAQVNPGMKVLEPSAGQGAIADCIDREQCNVFCIELLPENIKVLEAKGHNVMQADFLTVPVELLRYDRIVMNPPFAYEGHPQADIDHVNHALSFLAEKGRLISIMSSGVLFRENKKTVAFREMVADMGGYFERLPEGSFKESGTNVNTCFVVIER
jgi:predicted RNA methylase